MTDDLSRRDVLRGLGGLALGAISCAPNSDDATPSGTTTAALVGVSVIPAVANHQELVAGVHAYAQNSVAAGTSIDFRVSSTVPYQLSVVRLGWDVDAPTKDWTVHTFPSAAAAQRPIRPGSYVHVERALASTAVIPQLTLECWVRPFRNTWQGLITQYGYSGSCGFGLFLADDGRPCFYFGSGSAFNGANLQYGPTALTTGQWHHLVAVFDGGSVRLYVDGTLSVQGAATVSAVTPGTAPLRLGAYGDAAGTGYFLDGDLAMPTIYSRALGAGEISTRASTRPPQAPSDPAVEGCWPLGEEGGTTVADIGPLGRHGVIVNRATWMIGGPGFNAAAVDRHLPYEPDADPTRGHGLRLSKDDLYDCAWPITQSFTVPSDVPPGLYVGRILHSTNQRYDVTFVVRAASARPSARIVVLCATNTWHAYKEAFGKFGFYKNHPGGQPTYSTGISMPWPTGSLGGADPYLIYIPQYNYSHLVRAERTLHVWLEQNGYDYDVISDQDLHWSPSAVSQYRVMFIAGHSEYWSREMYDAVQAYIAGGGKVICASGNTMFWRVSMDNERIECRKLPESVGGRPNALVGELFHEHDHERGGLMREAGYPAWKAVGLECLGYGGPHLPYRVTEPTHGFFQSPEATGAVVGGDIGGANAVGHEWDTRLQQIPGVFNPAIPGDYAPLVLAEARSDQDRFDYRANWIGGSNQVISEIIDWPRAGGGRVLAAGSIAAGSALHADPKLAAFFRNALHHMGVVFRLNVSAISASGQFMNKSFDGAAWESSWTDMGVTFDAPPTGIMRAANQLSLMAISTAGSFLYRSWDGTSWSAWSDLGGSFRGRPAAVAWGRNKLTLFARGTDDHLYAKHWDGATWSIWQDLGGGVASDPAAIVWEGNHLSVAVRGTSGNIQYKYFTNGSWFPSATTWTDMGGSFAHAPTMFTWDGNSISIFATSATGRVYAKRWNGTIWSPSLTGWQDLGGSVTGRVTVAAWGPRQFTVFGTGSDGKLKAKWWDATAWGPGPLDWSDLGGSCAGEPTAASYRGGHVDVMALAPDGTLRHLIWNGAAWSAWTSLGGSFQGSPAVFRWIAA